MRVLRDHAYADRALDAALERSGANERDRALATELVYGTLRHQQRLDFQLGQLATRPLRKLHPVVLVALRLGAYQVLETRIPGPVAVHETVSLLHGQHRYAAGFCNALLRRLATLHERGELPRVEDVHDDPLDVLAIEGSHPHWLVRRIARERGLDEARAFVAANNQTPPLAIRVNRLRASREDVAKELVEAGAEVDLPTFFPEGLLARGAGSVRSIEGFRAGKLSVQDLGAQLIGELAGPAPGSLVLDACAAPGGKSCHLAELMDDEGCVVAVDLHPGRTRLIADNAARLGLDIVVPIAADATDAALLRERIQQATGRAQVDLALVDAPCSGLGTLRRNPELRSRPESAIALVTKLQDALLDSIAGLVAPNGVLVYAVCTVTREEGVERIEAFLARHPDFQPDWPEHNPALEPFRATHESNGVRWSYLQTWPHKHDVDGFFAARLTRRAATEPDAEERPTTSAMS